MTLAVAVSVALTASAEAATPPSAPRLASAPYASPAILQWTPGVDLLNVSQTVYRAPGACTSPLATGIPVRTYNSTASQHFAAPGDGTFCFYVSATDVAAGTASGPGLTVTIDTTPPTATVMVSDQLAGGVIRGTVNVSGTSADAVSGVASSVLSVGPVGACATGSTLGATWDTTSYTDGSYNVCNTVTDRAGLVTTAVLTVTVTNAIPVPVPVAPGTVTPPAPDPVIAAPTSVPARDEDAPAAPSRLAVVEPRARRGTALIPVTLRWVNPTASDLARVVVILNLKRAPRGVTDGSVVYSGLRTSAAIKLHAGKSGYVALFAYDRSGNVSRPARRMVSLAALIPLRPLTGSRVTAAPRMTWTAQDGTAYYNVQVFRNGKRIVVGWPSTASFQLPGYLLEPGIYTWYVWPAIKHAHAVPTFGDLIGRATFIYEG